MQDDTRELKKREVPRYGWSADANKRGPSINACLVILGADQHEVYSCSSTCHNLCHWGRTKRQSIYDKYTKDELFQWATSLYKQAVKQFHPDIYSGSDENIKNINAAYDQVKKILNA